LVTGHTGLLNPAANQGNMLLVECNCRAVAADGSISRDGGGSSIHLAGQLLHLATINNEGNILDRHILLEYVCVCVCRIMKYMGLKLLSMF
jgi:hypothetical protein